MVVIGQVELEQPWPVPDEFPCRRLAATWLSESALGGFESLADLVQQIGQRAVIGGLLNGRAGNVDFGKLFEIGLQGIHRASPIPLCHKKGFLGKWKTVK
jgi:hypothetical protein